MSKELDKRPLSEAAALESLKKIAAHIIYSAFACKNSKEIMREALVQMKAVGRGDDIQEAYDALPNY